MTAVLVVDDSLTVRMHLEEAFSAAGFEPILAADSRARAAPSTPGRSRSPSVDVLLPDGDGLELLAEIKRSPQHAGTPVVLLSTEAEVQHRVRGLQTGADEYVGKPYDAAHVVARARELVRRRAGFVDPGVAARPVLVVDDSVTAREELRAELERAGFAVLTAGSGEEGLRLAAERLPRAIVVDVEMPGMDGATFIREIRADAALRTTPCILLTASGPSESSAPSTRARMPTSARTRTGTSSCSRGCERCSGRDGAGARRGRCARAEAHPRRRRGGDAARGRRRAAPGRRARRGVRRLGRGGAGAADRRSRPTRSWSRRRARATRAPRYACAFAATAGGATYRSSSWARGPTPTRPWTRSRGAPTTTCRRRAARSWRAHG
jgi:DNA-binding response OmpR family regulator